MKAWKEACAATTASTIVIPKGTYPMGQVTLAGPCKAPIEVQIQATLKAGSDIKNLDRGKEWLTFRYVDKLTVSGGGVLDGEGAAAWDQNDCKKTGVCNNLPNVSPTLNHMKHFLLLKEKHKIEIYFIVFSYCAEFEP